MTGRGRVLSGRLSSMRLWKRAIASGCSIASTPGPRRAPRQTAGILESRGRVHSGRRARLRALDKDLDGIDAVFHEAAAVGVAQSCTPSAPIPRPTRSARPTCSTDREQAPRPRAQDDRRQLDVDLRRGRYVDPATGQFVVPAPARSASLTPATGNRRSRARKGRPARPPATK